MIEYRLLDMPKELEKILNEIGAFIAEEDFKGCTTYLVYASENIDDFLSSFNVEFTSKDVAETGWQDKWKEFIKEGWLNNSIYFIFEEKSFSDNRKTILINPSLAFGTGTHATTQIAARLLEPVCLDAEILDVGTGSGILSVAASIMGAKNVWAFDIDPQAMPNCLENVGNNKCDNVYVWAGDITSVKKDVKFNIVCANIISSVLMYIKDSAALMAEDYIVYSGILISEYEEVIPQLISKGWSLDEKVELGEWCGVRLRNDSRNR